MIVDSNLPCPPLSLIFVHVKFSYVNTKFVLNGILISEKIKLLDIGNNFILFTRLAGIVISKFKAYKDLIHVHNSFEHITGSHNIDFLTMTVSHIRFGNSSENFAVRSSCKMSTNKNISIMLYSRTVMFYSSIIH